jgi:hypothetical protein
VTDEQRETVEKIALSLARSMRFGKWRHLSEDDEKDMVAMAVEEAETDLAPRFRTYIEKPWRYFVFGPIRKLLLKYAMATRSPFYAGEHSVEKMLETFKVRCDVSDDAFGAPGHAADPLEERERLDEFYACLAEIGEEIPDVVIAVEVVVGEVSCSALAAEMGSTMMKVSWRRTAALKALRQDERLREVAGLPPSLLLNGRAAKPEKSGRALPACRAAVEIDSRRDEEERAAEDAHRFDLLAAFRTGNTPAVVAAVEAKEVAAPQQLSFQLVQPQHRYFVIDAPPAHFPWRSLVEQYRPSAPTSPRPAAMRTTRTARQVERRAGLLSFSRTTRGPRPAARPCSSGLGIPVGGIKAASRHRCRAPLWGPAPPLRSRAGPAPPVAMASRGADTRMQC